MARRYTVGPCTEVHKLPVNLSRGYSNELLLVQSPFLRGDLKTPKADFESITNSACSEISALTETHKKKINTIMATFLSDYMINV